MSTKYVVNHVKIDCNDSECAHLQVETTGDSYMMAAGLPGTAEKHAQSVTDMAFDMREIIKKDNDMRDDDANADLEVLT